MQGLGLDCIYPVLRKTLSLAFIQYRTFSFLHFSQTIMQKFARSGRAASARVGLRMGRCQVTHGTYTCPVCLTKQRDLELVDYPLLVSVEENLHALVVFELQSSRYLRRKCNHKVACLPRLNFHERDFLLGHHYHRQPYPTTRLITLPGFMVVDGWKWLPQMLS